MANKGPGPGQVGEFFKEVENRRGKSERKNGLLSALTWVYGKSNKHPLTALPAKGTPDMATITKVAEEAKIEVDNKFPKTSHDYCTAVWQVLGWIDGTLPGPPEI